MKRPNPLAAVYMLTNLENGKIYIGESNDVISRISSHRCTPRRKPKYIKAPIEKAIVKRGFDCFTVTLLLSAKEDPQLVDTEYRRRKEEYYIAQYDATNPEIGYNRASRSLFWHYGKHTPHPIETSSRLKVSKPILEYNYETETVLMYTNATTATKLHGYKDKSMITSCVKKGQPLHGYYYYKINIESRIEDIQKTIHKRIKAIDNMVKRHRNSKTLSRYLNGVVATNDWCNRFGFPEIDIASVVNDLLDELGHPEFIIDTTK